jgi:hypothetical protein
MTFGESRHFASGRWYDLHLLQGSRPFKVGASLVEEEKLDLATSLTRKRLSS